jgi:pyruvate/2-oxoacid:ferredoxin oxidoreductase alpha subunit
MAALVGAASTGARAFTATSAHGLALMHEMLHWSAGARLPIVMANVNRSMGAPWSIWTDQNDSLSQRDTGWLQIYCESNQEVLDTVIQAYKIAEKVLLPVMLVLDAFVLSHTAEAVHIPDQDQVDRYLPKFNPEIKLDLKNPNALSGLCMPAHYMEFRLKMQQAMDRALDETVIADQEFQEAFGRSYGLVDPYRADDAELILVTSSTATSTARVVIDELREQGQRVGLLKIRLFRPFPAEDVRRVLSRTQKVAVIDRNIGFGSGGIFAQEVRAALYNHSSVPVFGFIAGLGGRDITPSLIKKVINHTQNQDEPKDMIWIGVKA